MPALRLMTFNVQMLPLAAVVLAGQSDDAEERADRVADAILSIPPAERPDVIAFNEVFAEDGRDRLAQRLSAWPNRVLKIDDGLLDNDAGLMLLSRRPFHTLPTGGVLFEHFYSVGAGTDALACKAVGIVQVDRPAEVTTIAFTHLQASYATEDEHRDVRAQQFQEIHDAIAQVLGPDSSEWRNLVLVGDLNVRGDSGAQTDEWTETFRTSGAPFQVAFLDGWRSWMHPPGTDSDPDPGFTNIDLASGKLQRLDYHCFSDPGVPATGAVPHHMFTRLRDQSDHFSLEAVISRWSPNCTPATAIDLTGIAPVPAAPPLPMDLRLLTLDFRDLDGFQWVHVRRPGTFTVFAPPELTVRLFLETDLSRPVTPSGTLAVTEIPPEGQNALAETGVDPSGTTFAARTPFLIAVQTTAVDPGFSTIAVFEHFGDTPATAIWVTPHAEIPSTFPVGQPLGVDDLCWFRARPVPTFAGEPRRETFTFVNGSGFEIGVNAFDAALQEIGGVSGSQTRLPLKLEVQGNEVRLFAMKRASRDAVGMACRWDSPVSYLALDRPMGFYVNDESGPDILGDDEITLDIVVDDASVFSGSWGSADTGERWPGLAEAIRIRCDAVLPGMRRLPFTRLVTLGYSERDISASGSLVELIRPLAPTDRDIVDRRVNLHVPDAISDGRYTFYCSVSRFQE